jgi:hypothetical protein
VVAYFSIEKKVIKIILDKPSFEGGQKGQKSISLVMLKM